MKKEAVSLNSSSPVRPIHLFPVGFLLGAILVISSLNAFHTSSKLESLSTELKAAQATAVAGKLNFHLSEKEWQVLYRHYNDEYFGGKLPNAIVRSEEMEPHICGQTRDYPGKTPVIAMNPLAILGDKHAREVLLHEMIHLKIGQKVREQTPEGGWTIVFNGDPHGADFQQELHRLLGMGAFDDLLS